MIKIAILSLAALSCSTAPLGAAPRSFSFFGVEFEPQAERALLAEQYVARAMPAGVPMAVAIAAARQAGARCSDAPDGTVACTATSLVHPVDHDLQDVVWTVRLTPAADGSLAQASVTRSVSGL